MDWDRKPDAYKDYPDRPRVTLPEPDRPDVALERLLGVDGEEESVL